MCKIIFCLISVVRKICGIFCFITCYTVTGSIDVFEFYSLPVEEKFARIGAIGQAAMWNKLEKLAKIEKIG